MENSELKKNNYGHGINRKYLAFFKKIVVFLDHLLNNNLDRNKMLTLTHYISIKIYVSIGKNLKDTLKNVLAATSSGWDGV